MLNWLVAFLVVSRVYAVRGIIRMLCWVARVRVKSDDPWQAVVLSAAGTFHEIPLRPRNVRRRRPRRVRDRKSLRLRARARRFLLSVRDWGRYFVHDVRQYAYER